MRHDTPRPPLALALVLSLGLTVLAPGRLAAQAPAETPPPLWAVRLTVGPAWDAARAPNDQTGMREHSANIARMRAEGVLVVGARFGELGLLVLRVPDEEAVRTQLAPDPAIQGGVFEVRIDRWSGFAHGTTAWLTSPEAVTLRAYFDAYNAHDADTVASLLAEDVAWMSVGPDGLSVEGATRAALHAWLEGAFRSRPTLRSTVQSMEQTGPYLSIRERATWQTADGASAAQEALAVYEVRDGLIRRVWYFPSVRP